MLLQTHFMSEGMGASASDSVIVSAYQLLDRGDYDGATVAAQGILQDATAAGDVVWLARAQVLLGIVAGYSTHYQEAMQRLFQAIPPLEASHHRPELARGYVMLGFALGMLGDPERGLEWAGKSLALAEQLGSPRDLVRARINRAVLMDMMGEWEQAVDLLSHGIEQARAHGYASSICAGLLNMGEVHLGQARRCRERKDRAAARRHAKTAATWFEEAVAASRQFGHRFMLGDAFVKQARALVLQKKLVPVPALLQAAQDLSSDNEELLAEMHLTAGMAACEAGQWRKSRAALRLAFIHAQACGEPELEMQVIYEQVLLERRCGRLEEALRLFELRHQLMQAHYKRRVRMVTHAAEIWVEAEAARQQARAAIQREAELLRSQAALLARAEQLHQEAMRDGLTELLNRRGFEQAAALVVEREDRCCVALVDADHFKRVNDQHGHHVGDLVLQQLAASLSSQVRASDILARIGGEEFVLLLPSTELQEATQLCERIRQAIMAHDWTGVRQGLHVTISIGVTQGVNKEGLAQVLHRADLAMYDAKAAGRNCVMVRR